MKTLLTAALALGVMGAARLMEWRDLLGRPMPRATERIAYGKGESQFGELWLPSGPGRHPVVVMIHGGCWQANIAKLSIMNWAAEDLRRRGVAVWNLEYRGVDQGGGGWPGTFQDIAAGADALTGVAASHHLSIARVVAVGHSAGGHLAMWLAARPRLPATSPLAGPHPLPIAAVVSLGGLPDLAADKAAAGAACGPEVIDQLVGPASRARPDPYVDTSPAEQLPLGVPQFIVNGMEDPIAPPWLGRAWTEKARAAGDRVQLKVIAATGHVELISPGSPAWSKIAALIERLARGASPP